MLLLLGDRDRYLDPESGNALVFVTNQFDWSL